MESEILNEKVEWEAGRVAAAFGVNEWEISLLTVALDSPARLHISSSDESLGTSI